MAKILPILGELQGSVAGTTFARNKGGSYVRARAAGTNPNSTKQQKARVALGNSSRRWAGLSQTNRDLWNDFAARTNALAPHGSDPPLTGHQLFTAWNSARRYFDQPVSDAPPAAGRPARLTAVTADPHELTVDLTWTPSPLGSGQRVICWQSPPHGGGRAPRFNQAQLCGVTDSASGTSPDDLPLAFPMLIGQVAAFWVGWINTADWTIGPFTRVDVARAT